MRVEARESDDQILLSFYIYYYYLRVIADRPLSKQRNRDAETRHHNDDIVDPIY